MNQDNAQSRKAFVVLLFVLCVAFYMLLRPLLTPILLGATLVILLYPLYSFLLKKLWNRPYLTSTFTTSFVFFALIVPFGLVVALIVNQAIDYVGSLNLEQKFSTITSQQFYQTNIEPLITKIELKYKIKVELAPLLTKLARQSAEYLYNFSPQVLTKTASFIFYFFVMHIVIFFLFIEGRKVLSTVLVLSPLKAGYEDRLVTECKNVINATVYGYLVTSLVQAILAVIGFTIAGTPAPLVFATLTFFMSLVPIVGATSVWLPLACMYFIEGSWGWGLFLLIYGAVLISGIDNILKPLIMQGRVKMHPVIIFFAIFGGLSLFGPIGILFGPIITSLLLACIRIYREDFVKPAIITDSTVDK